MGADYARSVGTRLRRIRTQKGMSLQDVQEASGGRWKAAVVGAYERGDRNVTVARLAQLADFYEVPASELLPGDDGRPATRARRKVVLNLERLERLPAAQRTPIERFASAIQVQRGDFNGRELTVREGDLMALALLYEMPAEELDRKLSEWGVLSPS